MLIARVCRETLSCPKSDALVKTARTATSRLISSGCLTRLLSLLYKSPSHLGETEQFVGALIFFLDNFSPSLSCSFFVCSSPRRRRTHNRRRKKITFHRRVRFLAGNALAIFFHWCPFRACGDFTGANTCRAQRNV